MTLVGQGQLRGIWRRLMLLPLVVGAFGVLLVFAMSLGDEEMLTEGWWPLIFLVLVFVFCGLMAAAYPYVVWAAWPARVRYYVDGTEIVVLRGRRMVAQFDACDADSLQVDGWISTRRLFGFGPVWTPFSDLPRVVCLVRYEQYRLRAVTLPTVLIWGREGADDFRDRLFEALREGGLESSVFTRA